LRKELDIDMNADFPFSNFENFQVTALFCTAYKLLDPSQLQWLNQPVNISLFPPPSAHGEKGHHLKTEFF
jgi:hypothetical protein